MAFICTTTLAQKDTESEYKNNLEFRRTINVIYSEKYILNSDPGDLTFFDQGHPQKRQYLLVSNIVPYFALTRRRSPIYFVINPTVRVRQFLNQPSLPIRTPSYQIGGLLFFNPLNIISKNTSTSAQVYTITRMDRMAMYLMTMERSMLHQEISSPTSSWLIFSKAITGKRSIPITKWGWRYMEDFLN